MAPLLHRAAINIHRATIMRRSAITHTHHLYHPLKFFGHIALADPWTTVKPLRPAWPICQGTGTADRVERVTPGSGPLNPI